MQVYDLKGVAWNAKEKMIAIGMNKKALIIVTIVNIIVWREVIVAVSQKRIEKWCDSYHGNTKVK